MDAQAIISSIDAIHDRFENPPILREHQKRVAAVCAFLADYWRGPPIDRDVLIAAALVHDLGNLTKADFSDEETQRTLMGEAEWARKDHWQAVQQRIFERYGNDDHGVTQAMLTELDVDASISAAIGFTGFLNSARVVESGTWLSRLLIYADIRCGPHGVLSVEERFREGSVRHHKRTAEGLHTENAQFFRECMDKLESLVQAHLSVPVAAIADESVQPYAAAFGA